MSAAAAVLCAGEKATSLWPALADGVRTVMRMELVRSQRVSVSYYQQAVMRVRMEQC
jgi:hypothetical protein